MGQEIGTRSDAAEGGGRSVRSVGIVIADRMPRGGVQKKPLTISCEEHKHPLGVWGERGIGES